MVTTADPRAATTLKRLVFRSATPLFLAVLASPAYPQTSHVSPEHCGDAQVLAIQGKWIALRPGQPSRQLSNWSCVSVGEEIALQDPSSAGQITVIYLRGGRSPYTHKCPDDGCRNGYKVEAPVEPNAPKSTDDQLLEFLFSIFDNAKSTPVKGILQGGMRPVPVVTCSEGNKVSVGQLQDIFKPAQYNLLVQYSLQVRSLNEAAKVVSWEDETAGEGQPHLYRGEEWGKLIESGGRISDRSLIMEAPLEKPAFYEVNVKFHNATQPGRSVWVLFTPEPLCGPLTGSYTLALNYSSKWPKSTPPEAVENFRLEYLLGLATEPDKAPTVTVPPK